MTDALAVKVIACDDPFPANSDYARRFWMSQLGPTSTALLGVLVGEGSRLWHVPDLAVRVGVSAAPARSPLARSLDRLTKFRLVEHVGDGRLLVRSHLPRLEAHQLARTSDELRRAHAAYVAAWDAAGVLRPTLTLMEDA